MTKTILISRDGEPLGFEFQQDCMKTFALQGQYVHIIWNQDNDNNVCPPTNITQQPQN